MKKLIFLCRSLPIKREILSGRSDHQKHVYHFAGASAIDNQTHTQSYCTNINKFQKPRFFSWLFL